MVYPYNTPQALILLDYKMYLIVPIVNIMTRFYNKKSVDEKNMHELYDWTITRKK